MLTNKQFIILATHLKINNPYMNEPTLLKGILEWYGQIQRVCPEYDMDWYCIQVLNETPPIKFPLYYFSFVNRMTLLYNKAYPNRLLNKMIRLYSQSYPNENKIYDKARDDGGTSILR